MCRGRIIKLHLAHPPPLSSLLPSEWQFIPFRFNLTPHHQGEVCVLVVCVCCVSTLFVVVVVCVLYGDVCVLCGCWVVGWVRLKDVLGL